MADEFHAERSQCPTSTLRALLAAVLILATAWLGCGDAPDESEVKVEAEATGSSAPRAAAASVTDLGMERYTAWRRGQIKDDVAAMPGARLVWVGDSITQGWRNNGKNVWGPAFGAWKPVNLGISADRTDQVLARLLDGDLDGLAPDVIVLLIGTNDLAWREPDAVVLGVEAIVEWLHEARPNAQIVLLGLFPRGRSPVDDKRLAVLDTNSALAKAAQGWPVEWHDIGGVFLEPEGWLSKHVSQDALHFTEEGYMRWAAAMRPILERALGPAEGG